MSDAELERFAESVLARLRLTCLELPEVAEEQAWTGTRWTVAKKNFAHLLTVNSGKPEAYAKAAGTEGPACVVTFRLRAEKCQAARFTRAPYFRPVWFPNIAGLILGPATDWDEIDLLLKESYQVLAPKKWAAMVE